jgi:hypothetical protein
MNPIKWSNFTQVLRLVGVCLGLFLCLPAHSQTLGRISGIVTDTSGGAVSGAMVTVTDVARGIPRAVTTDSAGTYAAPNLIPGKYSVHAAYTGFKAFDRQDIDLGVGADVHVDVTLQPGEQNQTITVTGEAPAITTTNAQLEGTINANALSDLPFSGHNYVQLLGLLPTLQLRPGSGAGPTQNNSNGLRGEYNVYVLDGVADQMTYYTTSAINGGYPAGGPEQAVLLPTDAIQEFNVVQNSKAEFGWRPGAQLDVAMKSGANAIHGTAFALGRDTALMTRNAFFSTKAPVAFEDYGGTFGGAIKKDKLFYLLGYEGQRYNVGNPRNSNVPTTASGLGTSSSLPDAINDLKAHSVTPSALSLALAGCVTVSAVQCTPNAGLFSNNTLSTNFPVSFPTFGGTDNGVARVDYHLNDHNNLSAEFFDGDGIAVAPVSSVNQPYWSTPMEVRTSVARAWWTWIPNSTWVNEARFGWDNSRSTNSPSYDCTPGSGAPNYAALGFVAGGTTCGFPAVTITGFTGNVLGGATGTDETSGIYRWLDNVSFTHGNHIFKFGGEFVFARLKISLNTNLSKGTLAFNTNTPALNAFSGATALENFMAGIVSSATLQTGTIPRRYHYPEYGGFVQDDWRISPRLTLNLGLRYEYTATIHEVDDLIGNIALGAPSGLVQQGSGGSLYKLDPWAFAPRIGLAWDVTGKAKTVVRAGFNIIYQNPSVNPFVTPGASLPSIPTGLTLAAGCASANLATCTKTVTTPGGTINLASLTINPTAASLVPWTPGASVLGSFVNNSGICTNVAQCNIGGVTPHLEYPMVLNWNFGVQHAITNGLTLEATYVGNKGQHLFDFTDINEPTPGAAGASTEQLRRPYSLNGTGQFPWFGEMRLMGSISNLSYYNALQVTARERATHGLTFLATYTYSHALDQNSSDLAMLRPQDSRNPAPEYGNSNFDIRHRFTFGPSYFIPGRKGFAQMLEGWQLTSTASVFSGRPMNATDPVTGGDDLSGTGQGQDRWTLAGNPHDFSGGFGGGTPIPCFVSPTASGAFAAKVNGTNICTVGLPAACVNAASAEPNGPAGVANNTGLASLNRLGCYMMGNAVIVPPAQGTFGSMSRNAIYGLGFWEWDMSIIKSWKIRERITTQFRAEIYNVTNSTQFVAPNATLSAPSTLGQAQATPDVGVNSPIVGTGGPRKIQFGLKFLF